ncbi:hypothetical protein Gpo141_00013021 [Globisporangium polare]
MVKRERYTNPFSPLELSEEDVQQLQRIASLFVQNTIAQYEEYLLRGARVVDEEVWKQEAHKENVRVYAERRSYTAKKNATAPFATDIPTLLGVGTIDGSLHDAMYGAVNPSLESLRIKTSYVEDYVVDAAVLATLVSPTPADPFRTMTVKWFEKGQRLHVRMLVKNRDMVFLESTGLATLANGECIGYQLLHSVHFPQTAPLESVTRGNMSICALYRQYDTSSVDLFIKAYLSPAEGILRAAVVKSGADALASAWRYVHCARMKKLAWYVHEKKRSGTLTRGSKSLSGGSASLVDVNCVTCKKPPSRNPLSSSSSSRIRTCSVCVQYTCSSCTLKKNLSYISPDSRLLQQELPFCAICIQEVMVKADALLVASEEVLANQDKAATWYEAFSSGVSTIDLS